MIVIAIIGILAAALFPAMNNYIARAHDTARYEGAKTIRDGLALYFADKEHYPEFPSQTSLFGFTHECSTNNDGGLTWSGTIEPIMLQYMNKSPRDRIGIWPLCYMYAKGDYFGCVNSKPEGYTLIFATEKSARTFSDAYSTQGENNTAARHCILP